MIINKTSSLVIVIFLILFISLILTYIIPRQFEPKFSLTVGVIGILLAIFFGLLSIKLKPIEIVLGRKKIEKLAAKVYASTDTEIFSVIEKFRAPKLYIRAFEKSKAKEINIIGSAIPGDSSFLGAIYRLVLAEKSFPKKIKVFNVENDQIRIKFTISQKKQSTTTYCVMGTCKEGKHMWN